MRYQYYVNDELVAEADITKEAAWLNTRGLTPVWEQVDAPVAKAQVKRWEAEELIDNKVHLAKRRSEGLLITERAKTTVATLEPPVQEQEEAVLPAQVETVAATFPGFLPLEEPQRTAFRRLRMGRVKAIFSKVETLFPERMERLRRALLILAEKDVIAKEEYWLVESAEPYRYYRVTNEHCECPDFVDAPAGYCKHRMAVVMLESDNKERNDDRA